MTAITIIALVAALWVAGGLLLTHGMLNNPNTGADVAETNRQMQGSLSRCEPAALVALALFLAIWPAVWVASHLRK